VTKLFSPDVQSISIGSCNHPMEGGVIDACPRCELPLRRRGFIAYRGQRLPEPEVVVEEVSTTESEEDLNDG